MAHLSTCEVCGGKLSSAAKSCPHCGQPLTQEVTRKKTRARVGKPRKLPRPRERGDEDEAGRERSSSLGSPRAGGSRENRQPKKSTLPLICGVATALLWIVVIIVAVTSPKSTESTTEVAQETGSEGVGKSASGDPVASEQPAPKKAKPPIRSKKHQRPKEPQQENKQPTRRQYPPRKPLVPASERARLRGLVSMWKFTEAKAYITRLDSSGKFQERHVRDLHAWLRGQQKAAVRHHGDTLLSRASQHIQTDPGNALNLLRKALRYSLSADLIEKINNRIDQLKEAPKGAIYVKMRVFLPSILNTKKPAPLRELLESWLRKPEHIRMYPFIKARLRELDS